MMLSATRTTSPQITSNRPGRLSGNVNIDQPLLDSIVEDFRAGKKSKLVLANRAIARFESTTC
jgi:hypothetical protein